MALLDGCFDVLNSSSEDASFKDGLQENFGSGIGSGLLRFDQDSFAICHYHSDVKYSFAENGGFSAKNRAPDLARFFRWWQGESTNLLAQDLQLLDTVGSSAGKDVVSGIHQRPVFRRDASNACLRFAAKAFPSYWLISDEKSAPSYTLEKGGKERAHLISPTATLHELSAPVHAATVGRDYQLLWNARVRSSHELDSPTVCSLQRGVVVKALEVCEVVTQGKTIPRVRCQHGWISVTGRSKGTPMLTDVEEDSNHRQYKVVCTARVFANIAAVHGQELGEVQPGEVLQVVTSRINAAGIRRVQFNRSTSPDGHTRTWARSAWVSEMRGDGSRLLIPAGSSFTCRCRAVMSIDVDQYGEVCATVQQIALEPMDKAEGDGDSRQWKVKMQDEATKRLSGRHVALDQTISKIARSWARWVGAKNGRQHNLSGLMQAKANVSVVGQVRQGTDALFNALPPGCRPHFIRCINPKRGGEPVAPTMYERFNVLRVKEQLINNGITDTVRVRQQGFAYRRDKQLFLRSYGALLGKKNPYAEAYDSDSEEEMLGDDIVNECIDDLMLTVLNVSAEDYQLGNSLIFVRDTRVMTNLDQLLSAHFDDGAELAEALRASDKEEDVYCHDVFAQIAAALDTGSGGGDLDEARKILADRLRLNDSEYSRFEKVLLPLAEKRALNLCGFVRSIGALGVLRVAFERMVGHSCHVMKLDLGNLSGVFFPQASYTSVAWTACLTVMCGMEIEDLMLTGMDALAVRILADELIGRVSVSDNIAARSLQKLSVNSTGSQEATKYTYSLYTATPAIRSLDLRGVGLGDDDCLLISTWLQRGSCKPVATVCVAGNAHIGYVGSRLLLAAEQSQVTVLGFKHQFAAQMKAAAVATMEQSIEKASDPNGAIGRMRAVREDLITYDLSAECARLDERIEQAVSDANKALANAALDGSLQMVCQCLDIYSADRQFLTMGSELLDRR
eukprot:COSAG06_NODE_1103_length_10693_cov_26.276760_5_plen_960_part_01